MQADVYIGRIVSVQGTNPGPASGITYTVDINVGASVPQRVPGIKPHGDRPPDAMHIHGTAPGKAIICLNMNGNWQFLFNEVNFDYDESCA